MTCIQTISVGYCITVVIMSFVWITIHFLLPEINNCMILYQHVLIYSIYLLFQSLCVFVPITIGFKIMDNFYMIIILLLKMVLLYVSGFYLIVYLSNSTNNQMDISTNTCIDTLVKPEFYSWFIITHINIIIIFFKVKQYYHIQHGLRNKYNLPMSSISREEQSILTINNHNSPEKSKTYNVTSPIQKQHEISLTRVHHENENLIINNDDEECFDEDGNLSTIDKLTLDLSQDQNESKYINPTNEGNLDTEETY